MDGSWQSVLALDVRFNGARFNHCQDDFKNWYLRRRSQLLRDRHLASQSETRVKPSQSELRSDKIESDQFYLNERKKILRKRFGKHPKGTANSQWSQDSSRIADFDNIKEEDYSFAGMAHIFDQHINSAVTCISFARGSRSQIALGSADGSVSICSCLANPPSVEKIFDSASGPIFHLEWSVNNELMITVSQTGLSGKLIVWRVETGDRLRQLDWNKACNPKLGSLNVASFHTMNNNRMIYGGNLLFSMNISTGQCTKLLDAKLSINSLDFCSNGQYVFIGDQNGGLGMFKTDSNLTNLSKIRRFLICPNSKISNISVSSVHDHFNFNVLISTNESLMLFTVTVPGPNPNSGHMMSHMTTNPIIKMDKRWSLLSNKSSLPHSPSTVTTHTFFDIKAEFCPLSLVHQNSPLSIVSGSTCGSVLFFSSLSDRPINILQGHERGVLVATFNYDESLLATSDEKGVVIIWKRQLSLD